MQTPGKTSGVTYDGQYLRTLDLEATTSEGRRICIVEKTESFWYVIAASTVKRVLAIDTTGTSGYTRRPMPRSGRW